MNGSARARTVDPTVNSRMLYLLSYRTNSNYIYKNIFKSFLIFNKIIKIEVNSFLFSSRKYEITHIDMSSIFDESSFNKALKEDNMPPLLGLDTVPISKDEKQLLTCHDNGKPKVSVLKQGSFVIYVVSYCAVPTKNGKVVRFGSDDILSRISLKCWSFPVPFM